MYVGLFLRCYDDRARAKKSLVEHWPYYGAAGDAAALVHQARSLDVEDTLTIANQIPNLDVPVRLVWGAADKVQGISYGYRLAYELGAPIERIEGAKHFVPEDHPEEVTAAVNELLQLGVSPSRNGRHLALSSIHSLLALLKKAWRVDRKRRWLTEI